jgi:hypothetical protein
LKQCWHDLERLLLAQQRAGRTIDSVVEVGAGKEDKIIVKGRPGAFKVVPRGVAQRLGMTESRRHATIRDAVAAAREGASACGLRALKARFGKRKNPAMDAGRVVSVPSPLAAHAMPTSPTSRVPPVPRLAASTPASGSAEAFVAFAREQLRDILDVSGQVLYSGASTLRPGEVYLLGLNPGGDPNNPRLLTIRQSLDDLVSTDSERREKNSYMMTWPSSNTLRRRVIWLLTRLRVNVEDVAASNLIFPRSRDEKTCQYERYADACWAVHERILEIVQPRVVIVYGNPPYRFLSERFGRYGELRHPSGHGTWPCRSLEVSGRFRVVGLPHMSLYAIDHHPEVVDWMKALPPLSR